PNQPLTMCFAGRRACAPYGLSFLFQNQFAKLISLTTNDERWTCRFVGLPSFFLSLFSKSLTFFALLYCILWIDNTARGAVFYV
ncbi:hypothetical protein, partial [Acidaminococcus fermentans]|uniref:hypothetical protein n=1 Tax=Acidaminococcus fermentans TaxID=905 RepID=UPI0024900A83